MIELRLPLPPSSNRLWRVGRGRTYKSPEYQEWLTTAGWIARSQRPGKINGAYALTVMASRPDRRRRDLDNFAFKAVSDLLVSLQIIADDSNCQELNAKWVSGGDGMTVHIEPIS